ncbi:DUF922 domain-containing protein [Winogradskyella vincentii]|uniref:DUF922 domain-containing protein n=1 Tax=Winogradskyella vincentii TaxID=2877122 RepID=A0ABS7Y1Y4_9FLAO|nr:hypothetical protein [Winogradskyella vincentii]MCA0152832.1 hypothetical protein [Winogradskyella vincentii]
MKKINVLLLVLLAFSCSPKLKSNVITSFDALDENDLVVVLKIFDDQAIVGDLVGSVKATDNGLSVNCTLYENINSLKKLARQSGANVIKITRHKLPDKWSTCNRLWANIYRVSDPKIYETQIEWREYRKLTWDDFKGKPDRETYPNALALTNSGFGYESGANMFKEGKVYVQSVFNTNSSWVLPEGRTDYVLKHEQIHFDITEIYSRKLRKELADAKVTSNDMLRAKTIFDRVFNEMQKRQEKYDRETARGDEKETQENWEAIVEIELAKYEFYKSN